MCGIAGSAGGRPDPAVLERMALAMAHRGPDGQGVWTGEEAGLAVRRLAVIDPRERSDQPMAFERWQIAFNGEIYNYRELRDELSARGHRFVTEGDTEVLLHAWAEWGEGALERLNGMFAFAVWDEGERRLCVARDPLGEKPLYWFAAPGGRVAFASELRALLQDPDAPREPDRAALEPYLARALMPAPDRSFVAGVSRLPGGHVLTWQAGRTAVRRWWRPREVDVPAEYPDAVARLRELLEDSVRLRLRSDVPVATLLSGGVDSSAVVTVAGRIPGEHRRHAFTARFPGFEGDEWPAAQLVARAAEVVEHHAVEPAADEFLADIDALVAAHGEPLNNPAVYAYYRVVAAARAAGIVVLLDGLGGDELFAGYARSPSYALRDGGPRAVLAGVRERPAVARELATTLAFDRLPRWLARAYRRRGANPYASEEVVRAGAAVEPPEADMNGRPGRLRRALLQESFATVLPHLLRYSDMNSMAHSVEVRTPLLDPRIAEFALSAPPGFLYREGQTKRILRDAVRDLVPAEVLARPKTGFEMPSAEWLGRPDAQARITDVLLDPMTAERGLFDAEAVRADLAGGRWRDAAGIWRALCAELWLRGIAVYDR